MFARFSHLVRFRVKYLFINSTANSQLESIHLFRNNFHPIIVIVISIRQSKQDTRPAHVAETRPRPKNGHSRPMRCISRRNGKIARETVCLSPFPKDGRHCRYRPSAAGPWKGKVMSQQNRERTIVKTSVVGIVTNVLLAAFKAAVGLSANSLSIVLDAVNNLTDTLSSAVTILGAKLASRKPDREHPMGHGRYEYLSALVVVAIILYAGVTALIESVRKIIEPQAASYSTVTLVIVAAAVVVKIALGTYVSAKGKQVNSRSLLASGRDALFDALISTSVLAAAFVYIFTGIALEAYVGLLIAGVIIKAGVEMLGGTLDDILGHRPDPELSRAIKATICEDPDVLGAFDLMVEDYGADLTIAAVHVEVCDTKTAMEIDAMTRRIQATVLERHHVALATVGIYSHNTTDATVESMRTEITNVVMKHEGVVQMHGFYVDTQRECASFDLIIDFAVPNRQGLYEHIVDDVSTLYPTYDFSITLDRDLSD